MTASTGHNSVEAGQLKAFVERIEHVEAEIKDLNESKKDIYAEVRGVGYDAKIVKKVVALRRMDRSKRQEEESLIDLYLSALGEA
jgi:uncharacterized protein (UPF0335 family)